MEMELGLKLIRAADDFTSDFQFAKDRAGPAFLSTETDAMFNLTAHLKGYKRWDIKIDINEDGTLISISGERQVKETVMVGWKMYKKESEIKSFKKIFRIPDGVILDKINAKFNEDESTLTITMPKNVKGIRGTAIEEVKENQELVKEGSGNLQIMDEKAQRTGTLQPEKDEKLKERNGEDGAAVELPSQTHVTEGKQLEQPVHDLKNAEKGQQGEVREKHYKGKEVMEEPESASDWETSSSVYREVPHVETELPKEEVEKKRKDDIQEITEPQQDQASDQAESLDMNQLAKQDQQVKNNLVPDTAYDIQEEGKMEKEKEGPLAVAPAEEAVEAVEAEPGKVQEEGQKPRRKRCKMCIPIVAGSTLLVSFVVFVIHIIRSKNQTTRRKD